MVQIHIYLTKINSMALTQWYYLNFGAQSQYLIARGEVRPKVEPVHDEGLTQDF